MRLSTHSKFRSAISKVIINAKHNFPTISFFNPTKSISAIIIECQTSLLLRSTIRFEVFQRCTSSISVISNVQRRVAKLPKITFPTSLIVAFPFSQFPTPPPSYQFGGGGVLTQFQPLHPPTYSGERESQGRIVALEFPHAIACRLFRVR